MGWVKESGKWYYLANSGEMKTSWVKDSGKWYYLYESGIMAANTIIEGYKLDLNGAWVE